MSLSSNLQDICDRIASQNIFYRADNLVERLRDLSPADSEDLSRLDYRFPSSDLFVLEISYGEIELTDASHRLYFNMAGQEEYAQMSDDELKGLLMELAREEGVELPETSALEVYRNQSEARLFHETDILNRASLDDLDLDDLEEIKNILVRGADTSSFIEEIKEYWIVSDLFADRLRKVGEVAIKVSDVWIWGRTRTEPEPKADEVVYAIAANLYDRAIS